MWKNKQAICIIRNKKSGLISAYNSFNEFYKDIIDRNLGGDYINHFEGWFNDDFLNCCIHNKNNKILVLIPDDSKNTVFEDDLKNKLEACVDCWSHYNKYGIFDIDAKNKVVRLYLYHEKQWNKSN